MDYLSAVSELNYMTQIVIMLYEDNNKVPSFPSLPLKWNAVIDVILRPGVGSYLA